MAYFFYGTLMDPDVLAVVLGRRLDRGETVPATLAGYRRVRTVREPYPMLLPTPGAIVEGVVLLEPSVEDERRIAFFEEDEYTERWLPVRLADGREIPVRVFFALRALGCSDRPWDLRCWARKHKARYLELCREWMREYPD